MATIFNKVLEELLGDTPPFDWFQAKVADLIDQSENPSELLPEWQRRTNRVREFRFNMFFYDPKPEQKKNLPYFDMFPLVFPLRRLDDGFTGINVHYLPPAFREDFYNIFSRFATNDDIDEKTLYRATWSKISRFKVMRPLIRKYTYKSVRSRFLTLNATELPIALLLPLQRFVKPNTRFNRNIVQNMKVIRQVYINSRKHIRFGKNFKGIKSVA